MEPQELLARLAASGTPPDSASALRISAGLDGAIAALRNETVPYLKAGGCELRFAYGPYGRGKTHLLKTLQQVARNSECVTAYVDCQSTAPFMSMRETYRKIAANVSPAGQKHGTGSGLGLAAVIEEAFASVPGDVAIARLRAVSTDFRLTTVFRNLVCAYARVVLEGKHHTKTGEALRALLTDDPTTSVKVSDLYKAEPWVPRPLGKMVARKAAPWLRSLCSLPQALGYPGCVLLFDETEKGVSHSSKDDRRRYLANLRNFVDQIATGGIVGCSVTHAVVDDFLVLAQAELLALHQRLERPIRFHNPALHNRRAVWVDLDELTVPDPSNADFYKELGRKLLDVGHAAGLPSASAKQIESLIDHQAKQASASIKVDAVRTFVKRVATEIAKETGHYA